MEQEIQKISDTSFKVVDYTPTETVYDVVALINENKYFNDLITECQNKIQDYRLAIARNEQIINKGVQVDVVVLEPAPIQEEIIVEPLEEIKIEE